MKTSKRELMLKEAINHLYGNGHTFAQLQKKMPSAAWTTLRHCLNAFSRGDDKILRRSLHRSRDERLYTVIDPAIPKSMYIDEVHKYCAEYIKTSKEYKRKRHEAKKKKIEKESTCISD
jgi:hypothetical protein